MTGIDFKDIQKLQSDMDLAKSFRDHAERIRDERCRSPQTVDVFISYTHSDRNAAAELCQKLSEIGIKYFLDEKEINAGEMISDAVAGGISVNGNEKCTRNGKIKMYHPRVH